MRFRLCRRVGVVQKLSRLGSPEIFFGKILEIVCVHGDVILVMGAVRGFLERLQSFLHCFFISFRTAVFEPGKKGVLNLGKLTNFPEDLAACIQKIENLQGLLVLRRRGMIARFIPPAKVLAAALVTG